MEALEPSQLFGPVVVLVVGAVVIVGMVAVGVTTMLLIGVATTRRRQHRPFPVPADRTALSQRHRSPCV